MSRNRNRATIPNKTESLKDSPIQRLAAFMPIMFLEGNKRTQSMNNRLFALAISLAGVFSGSASAYNGDRNPNAPDELTDSNQVSAPKLFVESRAAIQKTLKVDPTYEGEYSYAPKMEEQAAALFRSRIKDLFSQYSDRATTYAGSIYTVNFDKNESFDIGIDLNFEVGQVLASDTRITSISKSTESSYIDGKRNPSFVPKDRYSVIYSTVQDDREQQLDFRGEEAVSGVFRSSTHNIAFGSDRYFGKAPKPDSFSIHVTDKSKPRLKPKKKRSRKNHPIIVKSSMTEAEQMEAVAKSLEKLKKKEAQLLNQPNP